MNLMMVLREGGIWKHQSATLGLSWPTVTIVAIVASHQAHSWPVASAFTAGGLSTMHSTPRWKEEVFAMLLSLDIRLVMTIHPYRLLIGDVYSSDFGYYYSHPVIRTRSWFLPTTRRVIFQTENSMIRLASMNCVSSAEKIFVLSAAASNAASTNPADGESATRMFAIIGAACSTVHLWAIANWRKIWNCFARH